ncbi:hypothetical protein [Novosphingobium sp. SG707]|uniref:hypothetical protein n=1 Tax=Novosphingobium sp. SG707 TaxID=2586996 RepID=UPI001446D78D|nr:hypothetical protein [Novosphingobium sp. SG707]NKI99102.1 hypothetical protein [Novosphingobium sp. SG707]
MRKLFRSGRTPWAAPIRLSGTAGGLAASVLLGAASAQAQSLDVFGTPPAPTATASSASTPKGPQIVPVFKDPVGKIPVTWTPRPSPPPTRSDPPRAAAPRVQAKENIPAETPRLRIAHAAPPVARAAPVAPASAAVPVAPAPVAKATPVATPAPAIQASPAPPRAAAPRPAAPVSASAPWRDRLYPIGIGVGLALELGALWLILRWRARRKRREQGDATPEPSPVKRPAQHRAAPSDPAGDEDHAATIARMFDEAVEAEAAQAPAPTAERPLASSFPAAYADAQTAPKSPITRAATTEIPRQPAHAAAQAFPADAPTPEAITIASRPEPETTPPTRGVFKPSPLFNRIQPAEPARPVPIAPPDPLAIGFEALRLSTSASRIELRFRVTLRNDGAGPLGPIRVDSCMSTPEGDLPHTALAHSLATLMPGEEAAIAEEWRVPLAKLPALRLGAMRLLVGAARIFATVEGAAAHPFQDRTFLIGLPEEGGRLVPIPLDGGAHLYDNLLVQSIAHE